MLNRFVLRVKRGDGRLYALLKKIAIRVLRFNLPVVRPIHYSLYYIDRWTRGVFWYLVHTLWCVPLFKARCEKAGKNLQLPDGMPFVVGSHLKIFVGDNAMIGRSTIGASKVFDNPVLRIGNNSGIGYGTVISVSSEIVIGNNCMIGTNCIIMDSDDHPLNPQKRLSREPVEKEKILPVRIGNNVWIGSYATVLKGVTIGENAVIATHSVITKNVPPNSVSAGYPARTTLRDIDCMERAI
jgi:acetyltransferase-like isoleucine patch superfamily enzyme